MTLLRLRLTGDEDAVATVMSALYGLDEVERLEEVDDLMPRMRDDSSSSGLPDDVGPGLHCFEVEVPDDDTGDSVRRIVETGARRYGLALEFVDRF
ncbi:MAG TPA: hypothetical protein VFG55_03105 [Rhodanobacteraceae bacterium]|nr:hypothetical protein [Rhodanobacteraceae bacterium]